MKTGLVWLVVLSVIVSGCQKQQTEEERKAEVEREVQNRLAAERQSQQQQQLDQAKADLDAREKELADKESSTARPQSSLPPVRERTATTTTERRAGASYDIFYTRLEPHGSWFETSDYGYVWQPREARSSGWRPYVNGHWVYTDAGWTWVSEEPFGWATYHYGRWTRLRNVGWVWVPGEEWAPAWVSWRKSDDYVGWAPLPPEAQFDRRRGIRNWADNYYDIGPAQYCFVATRQLGAPSAERTVVPIEQNVAIINRTTNVTNITYNNTTVVNQGPSYDELRSRTEQPIPRLKLQRQTYVNPATQQGAVVRGEVLEMPAPVVQTTAGGTGRPRQVAQRISEVTVDDGSAELGNAEAAREAKAKIKAEVTPPSDAPAKAFVKQQPSSQPGGSNPTGATPETAVSSPMASPTPTSAQTAAPSRAQATASAAATATTSPTAPPRRPVSTATPAPSVTPTPASSATPAPRNRPTASPSPAAASDERPRVGGPLKSQAKKFNPNRIEPMPPGTQPGAAGPGSSKGEAGANQAGESSEGGRPIYQRAPDMKRRGATPPGQEPAASPGQTSASTSPTATPERSTPPTPNEKKNRRRGRGAESASPSPTPTP